VRVISKSASRWGSADDFVYSGLLDRSIGSAVIFSMTSGSSSQALQLPRLDEGRRKAKSNAPSRCLHLGTHGGDLVDFETLRQRKMMKTIEHEGGPGANLTMPASARAKQTREVRTISPRSAPTDGRPSRSTQRFNKMEGISISQTGSWLDARPFAEHRDGLAALSPRLNRRPVRGIGPSEAERFILKMCRDTLLRRYGSLKLAFKRFEEDADAALTLSEFVSATKMLLKTSDAQLVHRLLDASGEGVSLDSFFKLLDEL